MFKKLFHSALWGLAAAGVILFAVPKLNNSSLFSADDIVSFNSAVRIASPAVVNVYNRSFSSASINDSDQLQVNNLGSGVIMTEDGYILPINTLSKMPIKLWWHCKTAIFMKRI